MRSRRSTHLALAALLVLAPMSGVNRASGWTSPDDGQAVPGGIQARQPSAPDTGALGAQRPEAPSTDTAALVTGYVSALRTLAGGDGTGGRAALIEMERGARVGGLLPNADRLEHVAHTVVITLGKAESESLVPVIQQRQELFLYYRDNGEPLLASYSGRLIVNAAELYASRSAAVVAPGLAADAIASLAGYLQDQQELAGARATFARATELDPRCWPALLGIGSIFEVVGRYDLAVGYFSRAADAVPGDGEALLRLGVNLARLGRGQRAEPVLRRCLDEHMPSWVVVIAYEELAKLEIEGKHPAAAVALLREAMKRFPGQPGIALSLAFALDRDNRPVEARAALERVWASEGDAGSSPRFRYTAWPSDALTLARGTFAKAAIERLPALARALEKAPWQG